MRACATKRPTQVRQGLLFVWGESNPMAEAESAATEAPISTYREQNAGQLLRNVGEEGGGGD